MTDSSESFKYKGCYNNNPRVPGFTNWNPNNLANNPKRKDICSDRALNEKSQFYGIENNNGCLTFNQNDMNNMEKNNLNIPEEQCSGFAQVAAYETIPIKLNPPNGARKQAGKRYTCPDGYYKTTESGLQYQRVLSTAGCNGADGRGCCDANSDACKEGWYIYCADDGSPVSAESSVEKEAARAQPTPSVLYKCNNYTCQQDPNGTFATLEECNKDCKPSFVCNRPKDGFPSCQETQTLANQLKSAQDQFNDAKSRMEKIPRQYEVKDWCFLGGTVPSKNDYGWAQLQGQKSESLEYYQEKCDNTPGCKGFAWRQDQATAPYWYYTSDNFTRENNGGGFQGPGCQAGKTGVPYNEKCCHGFKVQVAYDSSDRDAANKKLSLYQNTIDSINNKMKQGDTNDYFDSLKSCQSSCKPKYSCDMDTLTVFPDADGSYNSIEDAENNCKPRFSCDTENWVVRMDPRGKYKDIQVASLNCNPPLIVPKTKITQKDVDKENSIKANLEGQLKSDSLTLQSDYLHMLVWGILAILFICMVFYYTTNNTNSVLQNLITVVVLIAIILTVSLAIWNYFQNNPIKFIEGPTIY